MFTLRFQVKNIFDNYSSSPYDSILRKLSPNFLYDRVVIDENILGLAISIWENLYI